MATANVMRPQALTYTTPMTTSPMSAPLLDSNSNHILPTQQYGNFYQGYHMPASTPFMPPPSPMQQAYAAQPQMQSQYRAVYPGPQPHFAPARPHTEPQQRDTAFRPIQSPSSFANPVQQIRTTKSLSADIGRHANQASNNRTKGETNPGPIPATQPVVSNQQNGRKTIQFEYSKDRVKVMHEVYIDIDTVNVDELSFDFKEKNCVYPRALKNRNEYKGARFQYEDNCNRVGWGLSVLNEELRTKRGLIQRAVDSYRNCAADPKLRSRRVRRLQKTAKREQTRAQAGPTLQTVNDTSLGPVTHEVPAVSSNAYADNSATRSAHVFQMNDDNAPHVRSRTNSGKSSRPQVPEFPHRLLIVCASVLIHKG